jgi:hypothetical protein
MLSGRQLLQTARTPRRRSSASATAAHFTPHLNVWKVRNRDSLVVTDDDPEQQIITVKVELHHGESRRHPRVR